ncbi:hypothetical protein EV702DRAFT_1202293 [Suillus placidus]|uniref:Uncharacterized protein n=1 Tax=Suillus placidus TaxID=48579 RepID=A0A9P6ZLJ3_9AGAM|nr:hypothetical protein EV702DRAFT_1202293 [Suillus placidus]
MRNVLVVLDPARQRTLHQVQEKTPHDWTVTTLPHREATYLMGIIDVKGLIFEAEPLELPDTDVPPGHRSVHINEVLLMWHTIHTSQENDFRPVYMEFKTFTGVIQLSKENLRRVMSCFTAVWGGLDLTKNPREAPVRFRSPSSSRNANDMWSTFDEYTAALKKLEQIIPVWPGSSECRAASCDYNIITLLDSIARDVTKSHRPTTKVIDEVGQSCRGIDKKVLKREGRQSRASIKNPWNGNPPQQEPKCGDYRWLVQSWVPEWDRTAFHIINDPAGKVVPGQSSPMKAQTREDGWTLQELARLLNDNPDQYDFMTREGGTRVEVEAANTEINRFLAATLAVYIQAEEMQMRRRGTPEFVQSSLRVSARVDLSVIKDPGTQQLHYFVTGISRGPGMLLYGALSDIIIRRYALEFIHTFDRWIGRKESPPATGPRGQMISA